MSSTPPGSRSSAELPPGTLIAGFRLERTIGRGSRATVYEAAQLSLDRRVALKVFDDPADADRVRRLEWPEHPGAVSLFGTGDSEHGPWIAMRLVPGGATLANRRARLEPVAAALDSAHAAGIVHGDVRAGNVLVDGERALISDFGLGPPDATVADDQAALAALVRDHPPPAAHRRTAVIALALGIVAAGVFALLLLMRGDGGTDSPPAVPAGTRAVGSTLAGGAMRSVDCVGRVPSGASPSCTVSQLRLAGRPVVMPVDGTITSWAVRGAQGSLALQILRARGSRQIGIDRSADEMVSGPGVHVASTEIPVDAGDRVALEVSPGAVVGIRPRAGSSVERWFGPLIEPPRPPERPAGTGFDDELLLRVALEPGTGAPGGLDGAAAARAPTGRVLRSVAFAATPDRTRTAALVVTGNRVAVDLLDGRRRLARWPLPRARPAGRLLEMATGEGYVRVRWRNPGGAQLDRVVLATGDGDGLT